MTTLTITFLAAITLFDAILVLWLWWMTRRQEARRRRAYRDYLHALRKAGM